MKGLALSWAIAVGVGCHGGNQDAITAALPVPDSAIASISLVGLPAGNGFLVGHQVQLTATPKDAAGTSIFGKPITWTSSNPNVATAVGGLVNPISPGTVQLTAKAGSRSTNVDLIVRHPIPVALAGSGTSLTTTVYEGNISVTTSPGAIAVGTVLTLIRADASATIATSRLLAGTAFTFGPDNVRFAATVAITIAFEPALITAADRQTLRIYRNTGGTWTLVEASGIPAVGNAVNATLGETGTYAILKP